MLNKIKCIVSRIGLSQIIKYVIYFTISYSLFLTNYYWDTNFAVLFLVSILASCGLLYILYSIWEIFDL